MKYMDMCDCMDEKPIGHTKGKDWMIGENRPMSTQREAYEQADKTTSKQINETGLVSRSPL